MALLTGTIISMARPVPRLEAEAERIDRTPDGYRITIHAGPDGIQIELTRHEADMVRLALTLLNDYKGMRGVSLTTPDELPLTP